MSSLDIALKALSAKYSLTELKSAYDKLSKAYRSGSRVTLNTPLSCLAYGQARMPATVSVLRDVAEYLLPYKSEIQGMLDLGCGPGSAFWAFRDNFPLKVVIGIDQSKALMQLGQDLLSQSTNEFSMRWIHWRLQALKACKNLPLENLDMILASYVLNELTPSEQRSLIETAWEWTNNFFVLVEPGTPKGFANIRKAREQLIIQGAFILAPCTHESTCPMADGDWCHFSTRLQRSKRHQDIKGSLPYEDEKYSYLIATKLLLKRPQTRIIKKPNHSSGLVEFELCDKDGLRLQKITKRHGEIYKQAKKAIWGDGFND